MNDQNQKHLENLNEIRSIMERSSSFLSLSGLGGIFAGIFALFGAGFAYWFVHIYKAYERKTFLISSGDFSIEVITALFTDAMIVLALALIFGYIFTHRNAKNKGIKLWNKTAKLMILNLIIPLITGACFIFILIWHGAAFIISATTLIFYGLALINASKYTMSDIRYLGISQVVIGFIAAVDIDNGIIYWGIGFGIMHIIYGSLMYFKYERKKFKS
jgi:fumarate reductase subunit D